ncbi:MAG: hypothetical protein ACRDAW_02895 [Metamycoplasmataceae bacterium]
MLNEKAKKIWIEYNKGIVNYSYDFTLEKMSFDLFEDTSSNFCWTIFNVEKHDWIPVNCSTMKKMPDYVNQSVPFFIDGDQYRFKKTPKGYDVLKNSISYDTNTNVFDIERSVKKELGYSIKTDEFELEWEENRSKYGSHEQVISLIKTTINPDDERNNRFISPSEILDLMNKAHIEEEKRAKERALKEIQEKEDQERAIKELKEVQEKELKQIQELKDAQERVIKEIQEKELKQIQELKEAQERVIKEIREKETQKKLIKETLNISLDEKPVSILPNKNNIPMQMQNNNLSSNNNNINYNKNIKEGNPKELTEEFLKQTHIIEDKIETILEFINKKSEEQRNINKEIVEQLKEKEKNITEEISKALEKKQKNFIYYKYWELVYGPNEIAAKDFAGEIIIKDEFRTNSKYSWDIDFFDPNRISQEKYIASSLAIKARNKQITFTYKNSTYNVIKLNDKYKIIDPEEVKNFLRHPALLIKKIDNYFQNKQLVTVPYSSISSIFISFKDLPEEFLERMRALLYNLFNELDVFLDIFIYKDIENKKTNQSFIRIFLRGSNDKHYSTIFDVNLIARLAVNLSISKIIQNTKVMKNIVFDIFLQNHFLTFPYVSWFTNFKIVNDPKYQQFQINNNFIIDDFYKALFTKNIGINANYIFKKVNALKGNFYVCTERAEKTIQYASELSFSSKKG